MYVCVYISYMRTYKMQKVALSALIAYVRVHVRDTNRARGHEESKRPCCLKGKQHTDNAWLHLEHLMLQTAWLIRPSMLGLLGCASPGAAVLAAARPFPTRVNVPLSTRAVANLSAK